MTEIQPITHIQAPPIWGRIAALAVDSVASANSKRAYQTSIDTFLAWWTSHGRPCVSKAVVSAWKAHMEESGLSRATVAVRLAAVRKLCVEAADNGHMSRADAIAIADVKAGKRLGQKRGKWLSASQAQQLLDTEDKPRNRAVLAVLLGTGVRRSELLSLNTDHLQLVDEHWALVDVKGKGGRIRTIPIAEWVAQVLLDTTSVDGLFFPQISESTVYRIVQRAGDRIGVKGLGPHDLRRTQSRLARKNGADLQQIQYSLGHASVATTERYLGMEQEMEGCPSDRLPFRI